MPTKENYSDLKWVLSELQDAQAAEKDMREHAREAHDFVTLRQGQWEDFWWNANDGKPRYTFDQTSPIIDQVAGTIERSDFSIDVAPGTGDSSGDVAETYSGLIRSIQNQSGAEHVYNRAAREVVTAGLDGWEVVTAYAEGDSFDQDLKIQKVPNYLDRVWHGPHENPDGSDADYCWVLTGMTPEAYKAKYPDKPDSGVSSDREHHSYYYRDDLIMVGRFLYLQEEPRELVLTTSGQVFSAEEFDQIPIEAREQQGLEEERRRTRMVKKLMERKFSASDWLEKPKKTVFENWLPVVPCYGNFKVTDDKRTYHGVVEKLMDAQRVYNYAQSRQIEEGALAPRQKWVATGEQIEGYEDDWAEMNTSADPYIRYVHQEGVMPPDQRGGAMVNPGLQNVSNDMRSMIGQAAGMFAANMGDNPGLQSGIAIDKIQDRGDTGTNKYIESLEISLTHTARILVDTIPRVYGPRRQVRILDEDGSRDFITIGELANDDMGNTFVLHDLSQGHYTATCTIAPAYKNRQNETVSAITELGKVDPDIVRMASDILARNVSSPGMKDVAERQRRQLFIAGMIPQGQWTDEETQEMQAQQEAMQGQPPQEDPNMVLARAEESKAQADQMAVQLKAQELQGKHQIEMAKIENAREELRIQQIELQIKAQESGISIETKKATARKSNADAEAQEIQNYTVKNGVAQLLEVVGGGA